MTTYTWKISQLEGYVRKDDLDVVVSTVHWRLEATDGENVVDVYGTVGLELSADADFTPYEKLSEGQVIGWVQDALGAEKVAAMETTLADTLEQLANPTVVAPPLPWTV